MGWGALYCIADSLGHTFGIGQNIVFQNLKRNSLEPRASRCAVRHTEPAPHAGRHPLRRSVGARNNEIHDERANRLLTSKLHAGDLMSLESSPKALFRICRGLAQFLRALCVHPHPGLPRGKEFYGDFRAALIAPQIFAGVNGMSRCLMPSGRNASIVALTSAGNDRCSRIRPHPWRRARWSVSARDDRAPRFHAPGWRAALRNPGSCRSAIGRLPRRRSHAR